MYTVSRSSRCVLVCQIRLDYLRWLLRYWLSKFNYQKVRWWKKIQAIPFIQSTNKLLLRPFTEWAGPLNSICQSIMSIIILIVDRRIVLKNMRGQQDQMQRRSMLGLHDSYTRCTKSIALSRIGLSQLLCSISLFWKLFCTRFLLQFCVQKIKSGKWLVLL